MFVDNFDWEQYKFKDLEELFFMQCFATVGGIILGWGSFFTGLEQLGVSRMEYFKNRMPYLLIIDGGLSNVLEAQGFDLTHKLWSAKLLDSHPAAITKAHLTYLEAGAQCIITSSYQASIPGFLEVGYDKTKAEQLLLKTVELAEKALEAYLTTTDIDFIPLIAASIGPYGAYLANGSEYRGDYGVSDEVLKEFHEERLYLLDETNADFFACETIPSFQEAKVLATILKKTDKPAWVSFSCKDGSHINDGTKMEDVVSLFQDHPNVFAIGVNCTEPKYIASLIKIIKSKASSKRIVVYPNAGLEYDAISKTWSGTSSPDSFVAKTKEWVDLGADIIGGCCQIGPKHIKGIHNCI